MASEKGNASAWFSHVEGAVQLVKIRGKKQLRTKVGYSLFVYVRNAMVSYYGRALYGTRLQRTR
jgi:3-phenylpropionate/cinnamic acid dioxygenase small subunit